MKYKLNERRPPDYEKKFSCLVWRIFPRRSIRRTKLPNIYIVIIARRANLLYAQNFEKPYGNLLENIKTTEKKKNTLPLNVFENNVISLMLQDS